MAASKKTVRVYEVVANVKGDGPSDHGSGFCVECGEPAHVYGCSKPRGVSKEQWADMDDDDRLAAERGVA